MLPVVAVAIVRDAKVKAERPQLSGDIFLTPRMRHAVR
jgi:hypothetical protein